jgi:nifR3 family TIM-barrel protein
MSFEFRPFNIGKIRIDFPVILAPMAGYTDLTYRLICRARGAQYCVTEMILDKMLLHKGKIRSRFFHLTNEDHPVAGQIVGNDPAEMAGAARRLAEIGFDVVDLNFACPVHKALSRKRGGHMMSDPQRVLEIISAVMGATKTPVTIKLRRCFREDDTAHEDFWRIAEGAFAAGVAAICVHSRSVEAKYFGLADWDFLTRVKRRFADKTIIGSGDVLTPAKAIDMLRQTGVDAVQVARGVLGNPWFFQQVKDVAADKPPYKPTLAQQRDLLLEHMAGACDLYGQERGPKHMRKFGIKYARLHPTPKEVRVAFIAVKKPQDWMAVLEKHYK